MDQTLKDKDLFEDDTIEDELSKLEAEIEKESKPDDRIDLSDHQSRTDKKGRGVELDKEAFFIEKGDNEKIATPEDDGTQPTVDHLLTSGAPWYLNKNIICISTTALIIILFAIYLPRDKSPGPITGRMKVQNSPVYRSIHKKIGPRVLLPNPSLAFSPFIIPIESTTDNTYLFFRLSVMSPNSMVYEEIKRKKVFLRGDLYELLKKMVNRGEVEIAPREIKKALLRIFNKRLKSGKIKKIYLTEFLLV